jgi:hypothetical protein
MAENRDETRIEIKLTGSETVASFAASFVTANRDAQDLAAAGDYSDVFFPRGYFSDRKTFVVTPAARSSSSSRTQELRAKADDLVVLELVDGGMFITSAERFHAGLREARPDLLDGDIIQLDKLNTEFAATRGGLGSIVTGFIKTISLLVPEPDSVDPIHDAALVLLERGIGGKRNEPAMPERLGLSWLGTRCLMRAIEDTVPARGLCHWRRACVTGTHAGGTGSGAQAELVPIKGKELALPPGNPSDFPILVFVHGTASSTLGSFGHLRDDDHDLWDRLANKYGDRICGFEHRTLSESPIENAIALVESLPDGAHVSLVSHSRGGLVADLLCLSDFDALIPKYGYPFGHTGAADRAESARVLGELERAHEAQREQLAKLARRLRQRKIVIERYVRTASPANGTLLASGNFDLFLSGLLTLIGAVPFFFGEPVYWAFRRAVIEIARRRTDPHLVPGIEAMLPDSPMAQLLRDAPAQEGLKMAVIAGDMEGGNLLSRLGLALTNFLLFDKEDNDLVVNTPAMLAGIAPQARARVLFDRGAHVSHFRYFANADSRTAMRDWLTSEAPEKLVSFSALPGREEYASAMEKAGRRDHDASVLPIVVVLPDIMGSHLVSKDGRVWFDPAVATSRGLAGIDWAEPGIEAQDLFDVSYAELCGRLAESHHVVRFPYDWRQPLQVLGERLGQFLDNLAGQTGEPIRLLAHGMGGLVIRACIHQRRSVMDRLMERAGARLIMLGTPNNGSFAAVEHLLGKGEALRTLWRLAPTKNKTMCELLERYARFPGALHLLPRPGFDDTFQNQGAAGVELNFHNAAFWENLSTQSTDPWFGEQSSAKPDQKTLNDAAWLWHAEGLVRIPGEPGAGDSTFPVPLAKQARAGKETSVDTAGLPQAYEKKSVYVFGLARHTPCGLQLPGGGKPLRLVGTASGDGVVSWASGRLRGIGSYYYMPVQHGDLTAAPDYFQAIAELLTTGATTLLGRQPPAATRGIEHSAPILYDVGPPIASDVQAVQRCLMGGSLRSRTAARTRRRLAVDIKAMDLRFLAEPIMVGHYEQDPIAGPEALIDRELLGGDLSKRYSLGLYAGPRGSAAVVLRSPPGTDAGSGRVTGAVVTGLGPYDGSLSATDLTEAVRVGALRYLLQVVDVLGKDERELRLASLLMGFSSSANLSVAASVEALVRGVTQANGRFYETTGLNIRIAWLDIVELYLDTAITAVYALRQLRERLVEQALLQQTTLVVCNELTTGEGMRQRLFDDRAASYWPRLIVTDADRSEETAGAAALAAGMPQDSRPAPIAERLRFMYVGTRARAVTVVQQRQPNLIEGLVRQQIGRAEWNEDFGRMLFQLMVPHDFKDAARQLDRVVLVVDSYTANLPWELMLAEGPPRGKGDNNEARPLALRAAVVRQLSSTRYRAQVTQAAQRNALVIGNPSIKGFAAAFLREDNDGKAAADPPGLPGAAQEAAAVAEVLEKHGYTVERLIGQPAAPAGTMPGRAGAPGPALVRKAEATPQGAGADAVTASDVLAALYRQPWRILHIAAHGVFDQPHADGCRRSGVLLSDGLLITAAEIAAMEVVPELVFLNCCHSGQVDAGRSSNKLAASVARELIDIGVRCVIVAGWAINDQSALRFADCFYKDLLGTRKQFGDAVFSARKAAAKDNLHDITWGAFQAYGDPGWMAESLPEDIDEATAQAPYVAIDEFLEDLADTRVRMAHQHDTITPYDSGAMANRVDQLTENCPPNWLNLPQMHSALGTTWRELNRDVAAYREFLASIQWEDQFGRVPIHDIEQLADVESRLGEQQGAEGFRRKVPVLQKAGDALIGQACKRLDGLSALAAAPPPEIGDAVAGAGTGAGGALLESRVNCVRMALLARVLKRKASLRAYELQYDSNCDAVQMRAKIRAHLQEAITACKGAEGLPGSARFAPGLVLDRLALEALTLPFEQAHTTGNIALTRFCGNSADDQAGERSGPALHLLAPKALLVRHLLQRTLGDESDAGQLAFEEIAAAYAQATSNITLKPSEIDTIVGDAAILARFYAALAPSPNPAEAALMARTADRLEELARRLRPAGTQSRQWGDADSAPSRLRPQYAGEPERR